MTASLGIGQAGWPEFLGPMRDGRAGDGELPRAAVIEPAVRWTRSLGPGYSGVAVDGGLLFTQYTGIDEGKSWDLLVALDADDGSERWRFRLAPGGSDDGPLSTPAVKDGAVYALDPGGVLAAVDAATGKRIWRRDLAAGLGGKAPLFGMGSSPLVAGDVVVVQPGNPAGKTVCGLGRTDGAVRWCTGDSRVGYQSPAWLRVGKERQLVATSETHLIALEPGSGEVLWSYRYRATGSEGTAHAIPLGDGRFALEGAGGLRVYELVGGGKRPAAGATLWGAPGGRAHYDFPVYLDGHVYGFRDRDLACVDASSGELAWSEDLGPGQAILAGHLLLIWNTDGTLRVAEAHPSGYRELASRQILERGSVTTPSFDAGTVYVRGGEQLAAVSLAGEGKTPEEPSAGSR